MMSALWLAARLVALLVGGYLAYTVYLAVVLKWEDEATLGLGYFGRPAAGRARFKRLLRRQAVLLAPLLWLNARLAKLDFRRARVVVRDVSFPAGSCSIDSVVAAAGYVPDAHDIFVVTQMKCGTTWMQHVVYEVLHRGDGALVETGTALYAVAPWLEGRRGVPVTEAPPLGTERPSRLIKTHLPASLCPSAPSARYVYVARHPVSCFASCMDFVATNVGAMAPRLSAYETWFTSPDLMWWGTWPEHVGGWYERAQRDGNVLFVHFEDMKRDLAAVVHQVAAFLDMAPLNDGELARVVDKCGFRYMQEHQAMFEMHPPHILQTNAELFVRGTVERHADVPAETARRIREWAAARLEGAPYPLATHYPDVVAAGA